MRVAFAAVVSILLSVAAQFLLKTGVRSLHAESQSMGFLDRVHAGLTSIPLLCGFSIYAGGAIIWLYVLAHWDVSKAYPIVGLGFVLTAFLGYFMAGESLSWGRLGGIACICIGVFLVARS